MGKPKKNNKTPTGQVKVAVKEPIGKTVQYIGLVGARFQCPNCARTFRKGMVREFNKNYYCSESCAAKDA